MPEKPWISRDDALKKLQKYCAYQDRCHQEVRQKLLDLGVYGDELEGIMADLIEENFLNEERFACSYARGKFRIKHWGRLRIIRELKARGISDYCLRKALEEIEEESYLEVLRDLLEKRAQGEIGYKDFEKRARMARYAIQKGFEPSLVWEIVKSIVPL